MARRLEAKRAARPSLFESFDKFQFNRNADVAFVVRFSQKSADGRASDLTIIASEFINVHADEFAGELPIHVACVSERVSDGFVPVCETVVDAFANDVANVTTHWWRD